LFDPAKKQLHTPARFVNGCHGLGTVYPNLDPALVAVAIGSGAIGASHVTDPGFWFVKEAMGIPMDKMFAFYTAATTIAACIGLFVTLLLAEVVG